MLGVISYILSEIIINLVCIVIANFITYINLNWYFAIIN